MSSVKGHLLSKFVFHQRSSSIKGHFSVKGCIPQRSRREVEWSSRFKSILKTAIKKVLFCVCNYFAHTMHGRGGKLWLFYVASLLPRTAIFPGLPLLAKRWYFQSFQVNKNDYRRISSDHIIYFGDSQDIIYFILFLY